MKWDGGRKRLGHKSVMMLTGRQGFKCPGKTHALSL